MDPKYAEAFAEINEIIDKLRCPENGCKWDRKQTAMSMLKCLKEEVAEFEQAMLSGDYGHACDEAGDVFFNICFILKAAADEGLFSPEDALGGVSRKMVGRHPHVFGGVKAASEEEAKAAYMKAKEAEGSGRG